MVDTFCFVEKPDDRGEEEDREGAEAEWAVVASADSDYWLAAFQTEEAANNYAMEVNALADIWCINRHV